MLASVCRRRLPTREIGRSPQRHDSRHTKLHEHILTFTTPLGLSKVTVASTQAAELGRLGKSPLGRINGSSSGASSSSGRKYERRNYTSEAAEYLTRSAHFRPYWDELVSGIRHGPNSMAVADERAYAPPGDGALGDAPPTQSRPRPGNASHSAVWLFSYPNSGTTWMQDLLEEVSGEDVVISLSLSLFLSPVIPLPLLSPGSGYP